MWLDEYNFDELNAFIPLSSDNSQLLKVIKTYRDDILGSVNELNQQVVHYTDDYVKRIERNSEGKLVAIASVSQNLIGSVIWNGNDWDESKMDDPEFKKEVDAGRIVNAEWHESLTAKYIRKYVGSLRGSIVYLGQCWSGYNEILANEFLEKGASAVLGNTMEIQGLYGNIMEYTIISSLKKINPLTGKKYTIEEALILAKSKYGVSDKILYPEMDGSRVVCFGNENFALGDTNYSVVTIQPWYDEESQKTGDSKISLPSGVANQGEIIIKAGENLVGGNITFAYQSKNEIIDANILSILGPNQIILFQGHGSRMDMPHEETIIL